jgi:hypothetical protein
MLLAIRGSENLRVGDRVGVRFDPAAVHWVDVQTGQRL